LLLSVAPRLAGSRLRLGAPDHLHGKQILDFTGGLNAKKVIFHSISHLTEKSHDELQKLLPKNMFLSYDGMELEL